MKDGELRGVVLEKFYEVRNQSSMVDPHALPGIDALKPDDYDRLINISEQLGQHGLIDWTSLDSFNSSGGIGKITARGVDVVEGTARAPITVTLHDHRISITGSTNVSNVQSGESNIQGVDLHINKLVAAIDHSEASHAEKAEAKSLLQKLFDNPILKKIFSALFGGSGS